MRERGKGRKHKGDKRRRWGNSDEEAEGGLGNRDGEEYPS